MAKPSVILVTCGCHDLNLAASCEVGVRCREFMIRSTQSLWKDMVYAITMCHYPSFPSRADLECQDYRLLLRGYVSRKAAGKAKAVLEGVGLDEPTIAACFGAHPLNVEEPVQEGLIRWCGGQGTKPPTWEVLLAAMDYAQIEQRYIEGLRKALGL